MSYIPVVSDTQVKQKLIFLKQEAWCSGLLICKINELGDLLTISSVPISNKKSVSSLRASGNIDSVSGF